MNWKRIALGGLLAGVVMNAIDFIPYILLGGSDRLMELQKVGVYLQEPRFPFMPLWILGVFAMGFFAAWFYAVARPRLGAGPQTALMVGLALGLMSHVPYNFTIVSWGQQGRFLPLVWMCTGIVELVVGTLVAGWVYKDEV
jgi:hypothetical protein